MRRSTRISVGVAAVLVLAVGGVAGLTRAQQNDATDPDDTDDSQVAPTATAAVETRTLVDEQRYDGTLSYGDTRTLSAPADSQAASRTVTGIATTGDVLQRGDVALEIDSEPTVVLYGDEPMYRSLSTDSDDGTDVRQLEENLVILGYDDDGEIVVDEEFDAATEEAVKAWETDRGGTVDGVVDQSEVVFLPGRSVVSATSAGLGDSTTGGTPLLDVVVTERTATVLTADAGTVGNVIQADTIAPGDVLFELDDVAVLAVVGDQPISRTLEEGDEGADVRLLQEHLLAMGYDGADAESGEVLVANGDFDDATTRAVESMQFDAGQEVDGIVDRGEVAVVPADMTVVSRFDTSGGDGTNEVSANTEVLSLRSTRRIVEVEIPLDDQDELLVGTDVRVEVPGAGDVRGRVESVSTVVTSSATGGTATEDATVTVTIALLDDVAIDQIETPVDVYVERVIAEEVFAVPVAALVALAEGGFAVQVVDDTGVRFIAVETGEYADNWVEVTGPGIVDGLEVVAP
jgi:peptidoglycan hydrolase-like protein with peptidoglycan-binding domain